MMEETIMARKNYGKSKKIGKLTKSAKVKSAAVKPAKRTQRIRRSQHFDM